MDSFFIKTKVIPCGRRMFAIAMATLHNREDAEDAVQDGLARIWEHRSEFDRASSPEAYAVTLIRRICIDRIRSTKTYSGLIGIAEPAQAPDDLDNRDSLTIVRRMMAMLPEKQQQVLSLSSFGGYTNSEIAEMTGLSDENVRQSLSRARKRLKELFHEYEGTRHGHTDNQASA